jgi:hypothetical protein
MIRTYLGLIVHQLRKVDFTGLRERNEYTSNSPVVLTTT